MYIDNEGYLNIRRSVFANETGKEQKIIELKYKVNKDGLFEEVKD